MTEFVADKVQPAFAAQTLREQTNHLVERNAALNDRRVVGQSGHVRVHLLVHQPERDRLVADQRLIVRFAVGDGLLAPSSIGECVTDLG